MSASGSVDVECAGCHRIERWSAGVDGASGATREGPTRGGSTREVIVPGGDRRPAAPGLVAWKALRRARAGETGPVVARCDICGCPMVARGPLPDGVEPLASWTIEVPGQAPVVVDGSPIDEDAVEERLQKALGPKWDLRPTAALPFQIALVVLIVAVVGAWLFGIGFLYVFFSSIGAPADPTLQ